MKARFLLPILLCGAFVFAQTQSTTTETKSTTTTTHKRAGTTAQHHHASTTAQRERAAERQQEVQAMKADLSKMHSLLDQMRASIPNMEPKDQAAMNANVQMWQTMIAHFDEMVNRLSARAGLPSTTTAQTQAPPATR